jgi:uncharacterized protein
MIGGLLGLLGAGGSVLTVPALVYLLDQPVGEATTGALVIVAANAAVGAGANARQGTLDARLAAGFGAAGVVGALGGSLLNRLAAAETVLVLLALVMLASARALWGGRPDESRTRRPLESWPRRVALIGGLGAGVGVLTGFFGVGGGFVIVPVLVLLLGLPVRTAIGTSLLVIAISSLAGLAGHLSAGGLAVPLIGTFATAGMAGSLLGVRLGMRLDTRLLSRAFAVLLVMLAIVLIAINGAALGG